eukprot:TRINITY_DN6736_c0_g1_i3.p1 TRINITY_DN6736_c0_g1~~TRINITY_DN6736_c0_g1_i3.p1  ORF type:complete len:384 (+),score=76.66 TRINITY_DN6736_c0_g1_i3:65-1153(+)
MCIRDRYQRRVHGMMYFAKYQVQAGFKFSLDGVHNSQNFKTPLVGLYSLHSAEAPAKYYESLKKKAEVPDISTLQMNSTLDWDSPISSLRFADGWFNFKDTKLNKNLVIIVDVRTISYAKIDPMMTQVGWTVVPVFSPNGYVMSGIYQVPLFKGAVRLDFLNEFITNDPWEYMIEKTKAKSKLEKLEYLEPVNIIVRVLDAQREGHFNDPYDFNRINYKYLPEAKLPAFAYNASVAVKLQSDPKLSTIVPNKGNPLTFNAKFTNDCAKELGMESKYAVKEQRSPKGSHYTKLFTDQLSSFSLVFLVVANISQQILLERRICINSNWMCMFLLLCASNHDWIVRSFIMYPSLQPVSYLSLIHI